MFLSSAIMIDPEQRKLANYVKHVHMSLRRKSRQIGAEKAWQEHLKNEEVLRNYAFSMTKLAEEFWSVNNKTQDDTFLCRIEWIINYIDLYFRKELMKNEVEKEFKKMSLFFKKGLISSEELCRYKDFNFVDLPRLKLLDVGSCYNPFRKYDFLEIYPIDLYPAKPEVKKCNFIETQVTDLKEDWFQDGLNLIPSNFFDIVVFSLYLEYLPSTKQRYISCENAYKSLKINGLLLIVTPDSKHASANAIIMKNWKIAAAKIGFVRTKLEKLKYLYCMAFRKSVSQRYPLLLYRQTNDDFDPEEMFAIPQDKVDYNVEDKFTEEFRDEVKLKELFKELPCSW